MFGMTFDAWVSSFDLNSGSYTVVSQPGTVHRLLGRIHMNLTTKRIYEIRTCHLPRVP